MLACRAFSVICKNTRKNMDKKTVLLSVLDAMKMHFAQSYYSYISFINFFYSPFIKKLFDL